MPLLLCDAEPTNIITGAFVALQFTRFRRRLLALDITAH